MKKLVKSMVILLALASLTGVVASCGSEATAVPTEVPVAPPVASPTSVQAAVATPVSTSAPTPLPIEEPTAAPAPELVGPPASPEDVPRITVEELKELMDSGARLLILDTRPRESFQMGHIKGAIPFPWKPELTIDDLEELPLGPPIITYCDCGPGESDSAHVAFQLIELGVEAEFKVLAHPAIEGWIEQGYPTE